MEQSNINFVCIVAGDNPEILMEEYNKNKKVDPYVVYKFEDAPKIKKMYIDFNKAMIQNTSFLQEKEYLESSIKDIENMSDETFFTMIASDERYMIDATTKNIISTYNPNGHWNSASKAKIFASPFKDNDGNEVYQARKGDIDWGSLHLTDGEPYARVWEMVMENSKPQSDEEQLVYDNMKFNTAYLNKFETKENYVDYNTMFWASAFVSEKNGWCCPDKSEKRFDWVRNFYDLYIKNLPNDTLLTIYECK